MKRKIQNIFLAVTLILTQVFAPLSTYATESDSSAQAAAEISIPEKEIQDEINSEGEANMPDIVDEDEEDASSEASEDFSQEADHPVEEESGRLPEGSETEGEVSEETEEEPILTEESAAVTATGEATKLTDGYYVLQSALSKDLVLEVAKASTEIKANIQIGKRTDQRNQAFYIKSIGDDLYSLTNYNSGLALDVKGGKKENGTNVWQYKANKSNAQKWKLRANADGTYTLFSALDNKVLDVAGGKALAGTNVQIYRPNNTKAQKWKLVDVAGITARELALTDAKLENGYYSIAVAKDTGKALAVAGESRKVGANVALAEKKNTAAQYFKVTALGKGLYSIVSYSSGQSLDLAGGKTVNKTNIQQYTKNNTAAQKWLIRKDATSGALVISSAKNRRFALDITSGKIAAGTNVQAYTFNATKSQLWKFTKVDLQKKADSAVSFGNGLYTVAAAGNASFVLDIAGGSLIDGANLQIYRGNGTNAQKFRLTNNGDGTYLIENYASGNRITVDGAQVKSTNLLQAGADAAGSQSWTFLATGDADGSVYIQSPAGLVADISKATFGNGQNVQLYTRNKTVAQKFLILPTGKAATGFRTENGVTRYYIKNQMQTGWQKISGKEYYFDKTTGVMVKDKMISGKYLGSAGHVTAALGNFKNTINGQKTLTTYLHNALVPAGRTLYIWGGGWSSQDASRIGYLSSWSSFYKKNATASYNYANHQYAYGKGLDCSGYAGWVLYNTLYKKDGEGWTVWQSNTVAPTYINKGWATSTTKSKFKPGDVISVGRHVWISLGTCADGGVLLVHSSPNGVQLSGTSEAAHALAVKYMKKLNKSWPYGINNYGKGYQDIDVKATWKTSGTGSILKDPDGLQNMSAEKVMKTLFRE